MKTEEQIEQEINELRRSGALVWDNRHSKTHSMLLNNKNITNVFLSINPKNGWFYWSKHAIPYYKETLKEAKRAAERMLVMDKLNDN